MGKKCEKNKRITNQTEYTMQKVFLLSWSAANFLEQKEILSLKSENFNPPRILCSLFANVLLVWCNNMVSLTKCENDTSHRNTFDLCTCSSRKTEEANSLILVRQFFSFWTRQQKYSRKIDHYKILENYQLKYPGLPKPKDNCWGKVPGQALTACRV